MGDANAIRNLRAILRKSDQINQNQSWRRGCGGRPKSRPAAAWGRGKHARVLQGAFAYAAGRRSRRRVSSPAVARAARAKEVGSGISGSPPGSKGTLERRTMPPKSTLFMIAEVPVWETATRVLSR